MLSFKLNSTMIPPPLPESQGESNIPYPGGVMVLKQSPSLCLCQVSVKVQVAVCNIRKVRHLIIHRSFVKATVGLKG